MDQIQAYETIDGKKFFDVTDAEKHEESVLLDTAKCRISAVFAKAIAKQGDNRDEDLIDIIEDGDGTCSFGALSEITATIIEIAKFDKDAFLKLADEIKKTNLKTYSKDYKQAVKDGWIEEPLKAAESAAIEGDWDGQTAEVEEE